MGRLTATTRLWDGNVGAEEDASGLDLRVDLGGRYLALQGDRPIPVTFAVSNAGIVLQGDTRDTAQAGDIVQYPGHVMMWLGVDNTIVHAVGSGRTVELDTTNHRSLKWGDPTG